MKGLHWTLIVAIIIFAVLLAVMLIGFLGPLTGQGAAAFNETEFRRYCAWWAATDYKGTSAQVKGEPDKDMTDLCAQELKIPSAIMDDDTNYWNKCRDACRLVYTKV